MKVIWPIFISIYLVELVWFFRHKIKGQINAVNARHDPKLQRKQELLPLVIRAAKQTDFSILDYIMAVEHMSEDDKAWYELYKQYGNRNHTWQDFRDMFDGNIITAQQTVKNWQTWEQMNATPGQANAIADRIIKLMKKYGIQAMSQDGITKMIDGKIDASKAVPLDAFPDLQAEVTQFSNLCSQQLGNYCTYNPEIAKINRKFRNTGTGFVTRARYIIKMDKYVDLRNANFVVGERIENYYKIIQGDQQILQQIQQEKLSTDEKINSVRNILKQSSLFHGCLPSVTIMKKLRNGATALYCHANNCIYLNHDTVEQYDLWTLLSIAIHEDNHRVDDNNPNFGPLGAQIIELAEKNYVRSKEYENLYFKVPTEQSSHFIDEIVGTALKQMILQNEK